MPLDGATCRLNHPIKTHKVRRVLSVELNTDEGLRTVRVRSVVSERQHRSCSSICKCLKFAFVYNPLSGSQTRHSCCSLQTRKSGSHFSSPHEVSASPLQKSDFPVSKETEPVVKLSGIVTRSRFSTFRFKFVENVET